MKARARTGIEAELFWAIQHLRTAVIFAEGEPEAERLAGLQAECEAIRAATVGSLRSNRAEAPS